MHKGHIIEFEKLWVVIDVVQVPHCDPMIF